MSTSTKTNPLPIALPEPEMRELVARAQSGDQVAAEQLIEMFAGFLARYVRLLHEGHFRLGDADQRKFVSLWVRDPAVRWPLINNRLNLMARRRVTKIIDDLTFMVRRYGDEHEVRQSVITAFLATVAVYRPKGDVPFSAYTYHYFSYVLKKEVDSRLISQLGRKTFPLAIGTDGELLGDHRTIEASSAEEVALGQEIDDRWVSGASTFGVFTALTSAERQLVAWRYVERCSNAEIGRRLGLTGAPKTIDWRVRDCFKGVKAKLLVAEGTSARAKRGCLVQQLLNQPLPSSAKSLG